MGHYSARMGHYFADMGHQMGHEGTPMHIKMVFRVVMVKRWASRGVSARFSGAEWLKNQVKAA